MSCVSHGACRSGLRCFQPPQQQEPRRAASVPPLCGPPEALERIAVWHLHRVRLTVWPAALCGPLDTHRHTHTHTCAHIDGLQKHTHAKKIIIIKLSQHIYQTVKKKKEQCKKSGWSSRVKSAASRKPELFTHTCTLKGQKKNLIRQTESRGQRAG